MPKRFGTLFVLAFLVTASVARAAGPVERFQEIADAYFDDRPIRTVVLAREALETGPRTVLEEPTLYLLGQSFAAIHLYEKASDAFHRILVEHPESEFSPLALRALARIFFSLREWGAVVHIDHDSRRRIADERVPSEVWYLIGQSYYLLDRPEEALPPLRNVRPGMEFYPWAQFTLAQVDFAGGRSDAALARLEEVADERRTPGVLRERALRTRGMILYQEGRYAESIRAFDSIRRESPLYPETRVDVALAAEALDDRDRVQQALKAAMTGPGDRLLRSQARIAFGRLYNRSGDTGTARSLFDQALEELRNREAVLRASVEEEARFRKVFEELLSYARRSRANQKRERLAEDLSIVRTTLATRAGASYEHGALPKHSGFQPETELFDLLHEHFHEVPVIQSMIDLAVEVETFRRELRNAREDLRAWRSTFYRTPPVRIGEVPEGLQQSLEESLWLFLTRFDLVTRFYNELVIHEKLPLDAAVREKRRALKTTTEGLRLVQTGSIVLPSRDALGAVLERARETIAEGRLPGLASSKIREGFLDEWASDRDALLHVVDNMRLKERQLSTALEGIPLRSRNLNMPLLTTMIDWLEALEHLVSKYNHIGKGRSQRPWHLAGQGDNLDALLFEAEQSLARLETRAFRVVRQEANRLVEEESNRHSLIIAQAEEGIADALFRERQAR